MDIVLVQPPGWNVSSPPYNIALLKSILRNEYYDVLCFDMNAEMYDLVDDDFKEKGWSGTSLGNCWLDRGFVLSLIETYKSFINDFISRIINVNPDVIGFTVIHRTAIFTIEMARIIKEKYPDKKIILGGPNGYELLGGFDLIKESAVDAVCLGEAELCLGNLLNIIKEKGAIEFCNGFVYRDRQNQIINCGSPVIVKNLDFIPFADFSDFKVERYKVLPILTSKGCIYNCSFCSESICMGGFRSRSAYNIYSEIAYQLNKYPYIEEFHFCDSLINGNIKMLDELCDLIIDKAFPIRWSGQAYARKEMTKDFLIKLKKSGCQSLSYGVESGSDRILRLMNKKFTAGLAEEIIRSTHEAGIESVFNIIIGFPGETDDDFRDTEDFLKRNSKFSHNINLNCLCVAAGSDLDRNKEKWGIREDTSGFMWKSVDGKNTYEERLHRLEIYKTIIKDKARSDVRDAELFTEPKGGR